METKEKLIGAAVQCFLENGYELTSITKITDICNITKGAFYHHFKSKEEIFISVLNSLFYEIDKWIREKIYTSSGIKDMLERILDYSDYFSSSHYIKGISSHHYSIIFDAIKRFPKEKEKISGIYTSCMALFEQRVSDAQTNGEIKKNIDPHSFAVHLFSLAEGLLFVSVLMGNQDELPENGRKIAEDLWEMIEK